MKAVALLACVLLVATPLFAEPPSKESVEKLLKLSATEKSLTAMQKQLETSMGTALAQVLKQRNVGNDAKTYTDLFGKKMAKLMGDELNWSKMHDVYEKSYTETFTQEEIDGLIAFYESPVGQSYVTKLPQMNQKSSALMQQRMTPLMQRLQQAMQETINEVQQQKKKGNSNEA